MEPMWFLFWLCSKLTTQNYQYLNISLKYICLRKHWKINVYLNTLASCIFIFLFCFYRIWCPEYIWNYSYEVERTLSNSRSSCSLASCKVKVGHTAGPNLGSGLSILIFESPKEARVLLFELFHHMWPDHYSTERRETFWCAESWSRQYMDFNVFPLNLSSVTWSIRRYQLGEVQEMVLIDILSARLFKARHQNINSSDKSFEK